MSSSIEDLATAFARLPGVGPRQGKRFVYHLLSAGASERTKMAELIATLGKDTRQCSHCMRFWNGSLAVCAYCSDKSRNDAQLMFLEKDQDLAAIERAGTYRGHYFVIGGVLTLSGKGAIREKELTEAVERRLKNGLAEIILALSATSEGEHTSDRIRSLISPYRNQVKISKLGRGLATGSELEYADAETLRAALQNRLES